MSRNVFDYFNSINVCGEFSDARAAAAMGKFSYISRCDTSGKPLLEKIKSIPCKIKEGLCFVKSSFSKSWKLQFITFFIIVLYVINLGMIMGGHYNVKDSKDTSFTDSFYLTTTQITTIGYGDVIPQTYAAKIVSSFVHLIVMFLTYSLAEEFGAVTIARKNQSDEIKQNLKKEIEPVNRMLSISPELEEDIRRQIQKRIPGGIRTMEDAVKADDFVRRVSKRVASVGDKAPSKRKNARVIPGPPSIPELNTSQGDVSENNDSGTSEDVMDNNVAKGPELSGIFRINE